MCSPERLNEIKKSGLGLSKQLEEELNNTIKDSEKRIEYEDKLFRSLLL